MTALGSMLANGAYAVVRLILDLAGLTSSQAGLGAAGSVPTGAALAATILAGVALAAVLVLLTVAARTARTASALPLLRRAAALREKSWRAAFLRQRDPDARGRTRPRAPSAAPAAAYA
jgi:hypothetical protein